MRLPGHWRAFIRFFSFLHSNESALKQAQDGLPTEAKFDIRDYGTVYVVSGSQNSVLAIWIFLGDEGSINSQNLFKKISAIQTDSLPEIAEGESNLELAGSLERMDSSESTIDNSEFVSSSSSMDSVQSFSESSELPESSSQDGAISEQGLSEKEFSAEVQRVAQSQHHDDMNMEIEQSSLGGNEEKSSVFAEDFEDSEDGVSFSQLHSEMDAGESDDSDDYEEELEEGELQQSSYYAEDDGQEISEEAIEGQQEYSSSFTLREDSYVGEVVAVENEEFKKNQSQNVEQAYREQRSDVDDSLEESSLASQLSSEDSRETPPPIENSLALDDQKNENSEDFYVSTPPTDSQESSLTTKEDSLKQFLFDNVEMSSGSSFNKKPSEVASIGVEVGEVSQLEIFLKKLSEEQFGQVLLRSVSETQIHLMACGFDGTAKTFLRENDSGHIELIWGLLWNKLSSRDVFLKHFFIEQKGVGTFMVIFSRDDVGISQIEIRNMLCDFSREELFQLQSYWNRIKDQIQKDWQVGDLICVSSSSAKVRSMISYQMMQYFTDHKDSQKVFTFENQGFYALAEASFYSPNFLGQDKSLWKQRLSHIPADASDIVYLSGIPEKVFGYCVQEVLPQLLERGVRVILALSEESNYLGWQKILSGLKSASFETQNRDKKYSQRLRYLIACSSWFLATRSFPLQDQSKRSIQFVENTKFSDSGALHLSKSLEKLTPQDFYGLCGSEQSMSLDDILLDLVTEKQLSLSKAYLLSSHPQHFLSLAHSRGFSLTFASSDEDKADKDGRGRGLTPELPGEVVDLADLAKAQKLRGQKIEPRSQIEPISEVAS